MQWKLERIQKHQSGAPELSYVKSSVSLFSFILKFSPSVIWFESTRNNHICPSFLYVSASSRNLRFPQDIFQDLGVSFLFDSAHSLIWLHLHSRWPPSTLSKAVVSLSCQLEFIVSLSSPPEFPVFRSGSDCTSCYPSFGVIFTWTHHVSHFM